MAVTGKQGEPRSPVSLRTKLKKPRSKAILTAYLMILPALAVLIVFQFYPIIWGLPLGFTNYSVIGKTSWVGLHNFIKAFHDPEFWTAMKNSLLYVVVVPPLQIVSILLAVLINRKIRGITFFRTLYYIPVVTSMVAVAITWNWLYTQKGILNYILEKLHIISHGIDWLNLPHVSLFMIMIVTAWKGLGYYMIIYLAGLQSIPAELEESALIDGAGRFRVIQHITIPLLTPFILLCTVMSIMGAVRVFDEVYVMTGGGPANATMVSSLYIYQKAFQNFQFGYAAAVGLIVGIVVWLFTLLAFWLNKKIGVNAYD